jgi:hypothetical protein
MSAPEKSPEQGDGRERNSDIVAYFTTKDGRRVYAREYGYRGWPIGN